MSKPGQNNAAAGSSHGGWSLPNGADADKAIAARLELGQAVEQIAEAVGVATGYVEALARELELDKVPLQSPRPRAVIVAEEPEARPRVRCVVEGGAEIGARDCIDRQCAQRCFCPQASFAINAVAPNAMVGSKLQDLVDRCRAVALSVRHRPTDERYLGPAAEAHAGRKPAAVPLIAGELPQVPPAGAGVEERAKRCRCGELVLPKRVQSLVRGPDDRRHGTVLCDPVGAVAPHDVSPVAVPGQVNRREVAASAPAGNRAATPPAPPTPAPPAEPERTMAKEKKAPERFCSKDCGRLLGAANKSGICSTCSSGYKPKDAAPAKSAGQAKTANTLARAVAAARVVKVNGKVVKNSHGHLPPETDPRLVGSAISAEDLVRQRLAIHREKVKELLHHQTEAAKLERALAAMLKGDDA